MLGIACNSFFFTLFNFSLFSFSIIFFFFFLIFQLKKILIEGKKIARAELVSRHPLETGSHEKITPESGEKNDENSSNQIGSK